MASNNLHFEYSLSVNEKQTQQNLATFIKKTFGTDKNAKLSVPIKLDISTNLTNVDLKSIQDQLDKQFKGKLNLHATVKIDSSNVARQAQAELDRISKSLSLKVGLEVDPSAMKLMLGTVDVIKTLNKEVTKVKDNLKDLGKKIEININGAQINNVYDGALKTAEKIQKVNAQTTEEINEQLAMTKEQLSHQKKLAEEKKKELDIEKEKQANNKKIEESNKNIRKQQQQLNKELRNVEAQIAAEKKKADVLDKQAKSAKSTAKVQEDATKKIEKSTEKIAELEKQRADNQAFLQSKREEEKALLTNIELNKQEITLLRTKIKEMERLAKATVTVTKTTGTTKTTTTQVPKKPTAKQTSNKKVVQVDTPVVQATMEATNATKARVEAENSVTQAIKKQEEVQAKSVQNQMATQDKLVQHTEDSAKKIEVAANKTYRAEDSKRTLRMPTGRDKIYNRIAGSEFASSIAGYRIHDISSAEEQNEYELVLLDTLIKSRNVLTDFNIELKEGVALTEEQVGLIEERIRLIQKEMVDTKEMAGAKDKAHRQPFNDALKAFLANPNDEELGSKLDFQAEKISKIGAMYKYHAALLKEKNRLEDMLGVKIKENAEVEAKRLEMEAKRDERATGIKAKTAENQSNRSLNKNIYKDVGDFLKEEVFGFDVDQLDDAYEEYYEELSEQSEMLGEAIGEKLNFTKHGQVQYEELDRYIDLMSKRIEEWKSQMVSASDEDNKKLQDNIDYAEEDIKYLKMLANSITKVNAIANTKSLDFEMEDEANDIEETTEAMEGLVDPKLVARVRTQAENFDFFVQRTHALNEQTHQLKGEVLAMLAYFDKLNKSTNATNEDWEKLANNLVKYREILGKTEEEINEFTIAEKNKDVEAEEAKALMKATIKQGKEYVKQLQQQMSTMDKETEAWEKRNKAINVFKQLIKDESIGKEKIDEQVLGLYNLLNSNKEKDSGDFKESNSNIKIVRQQAKAEEDVAVKYEKQANALYQILKLKKEGKKVSFDINKLIDSEGNGWKKIAEQQKQVYKKMNDHQLWFTASHMNMNETYADEDNIFDPTHFIDFTKELNGREEIINFLSEATAKMHILEELQEKMKTHEPMKNGKASLDIANKTTKARIEEAQAMDAITAKQKEQQKNEEIHQEWLKNQEIAKEKEPYLKASKEIMKRIKGSTVYKNNKDDEKFMNSVKQTFMYIDNLKHGEATLQQTIDAFEQLKTYAHETFHMKNETIKKLVEPFVKIEEAVAQTTEDMKKVEASVEEVAQDAQTSNQATQEKAQADAKATQEVKEQAQAQDALKENVEATAEATKKQVKAQKEMSAELRKQLTQIIPNDVLSSIPSEMLDKMFEGVAIAVDKGIKLTKTKFKDIIGVADGLNQLDYSKALGQRGTLVAQGRKKKDGVIYNRTDEYKAKKEAMDKQVEELEKPLLDILKMMEKELKGTTTKVAKEVKKSEKQQNKTAKTENKTKVEQNKLAQQQEAISSNIDKKQSNILQTAKDILLANKEGRQYILDINSLIDEQGRSWQDIAKNSEKVYKNVKDANILYTSFENMDMNRAYGNDAQSNGIFTPANYIDRDKYDKAKTDAERIALMSEYDGKFGILFSLEEAFKQLLEQENIQENIQEKVETSLYDQIQAIEKMTNTQKRFNAILELTGLNYDNIYEQQLKEQKQIPEWEVNKNYQTAKMNYNYTKPLGFKTTNPLAYMEDPSSVSDVKAFNAEYFTRIEILSKYENMKLQANKENKSAEEKINELLRERESILVRLKDAQEAILTDEEKHSITKELKEIKKEYNSLINTGQLKQFYDTINSQITDEVERKKEYQNSLMHINYTYANNPNADFTKYGVTDNAQFMAERKKAMDLDSRESLLESKLRNDSFAIDEIKKAQSILDNLDGEIRALEGSTEALAKHKNDIANADKISADLTEQQVVQQDKVETSLYDQIQAIEKMTNSQERFNAILELTGYEYDEQHEKNMNFYNYKSKTTSGQRAIKQRYTYLDNLGKNSDDPYDIASYNLPSLNSKNLTKNNRYSKENLGLLSTYSVYEEVLEKFKNLKNSTIGNSNIEKEVEKVAQATDNIVENEQKQVTVQEQVVQAKQKEQEIEEEINKTIDKGTSAIQERLEAIDKLTGIERVKAMEEFMLGAKSDEISQNPKRGKYYTLDYFINNAFEDLKRARTSPEAVEQIIAEKLDLFLSKALGNKDVAHLFDFDKFKGVYSPEYDRNYMFNNKDTLFKQKFTMEETDSGAYEKMLDQRLDALKMMSTYEGLKLFFAKFAGVYRDYAKVITEGAEVTTNALEKESEATKQVTDSIQKQVVVQEQSNNAKKEEAKIESETIDNTQKLTNLENKRKQILASIKYTKEDMLSFDELDNLKEDLRLNKEKTRELRKQGETAKFLEKVKEDAEEGQSAKLANKRLQEIFKNQNKDYSKYGITDVEKFIKEQKAIGVLSNEQVGMKQDIEAQRSLQDELYEYEKQLKNIDKQIEEINSKKQEELKITQDVAKVTEQMSNTLEEPLKDLRTLEEYQREYTKKSGFTHTEETFEGLDESMHEKHKFSDNAIGYLDGLLGKFRKTGGGVDASYAGLGLPRDLIDSLGSENLNKIIAEHMEKYHKEYGKVARMYKDLAYLAETLGGNVEGNKEFEELNLKVTQLEEKIRKEAIALINDALLSTNNIWYQDEKYDDANDIRIMGESNVYRTAMSDTDYYVDHQDYDELVKTSKEKLANLLKNKVVEQEIIQEVKNENKETQNLVQSVNKIVEDKKEEEEVQANITEDKKEEEKIQTNIVEDKKEEVDATNQLVNTKQQELNVTNEIAKAVQETKEEEEVLNKFVEKGNEDWYKTYQYLSRVVESSKEFAKANRLAKEEWEELKEEADMSETDDQWKEMVKRVYDFANELGVAFKTEKGLYDQRKQALKDINILSTSVEEVVAKSLTMESKDGESDRTYGSLDETLEYNKAKLESLGISEKQIEATNEEAKAENELAKAKNETANATDKANKAKEKSNKTNKASKPKQSDTSLEEMISIPKSTNKRDYIDGTLNAIKKVIGSSTFKKYAVNDASLKDAINDLDKEAKVNKSSDVGIDYWEGLIKRLKELGAKGHVQETTIDNMLIPYIGGEIPKSKANKAVKDKAASLGTTSKETVDDAKKIETSTVNTAKAQNDVAKATKVVKVDTNEVAKSTNVVKQNIAETTESLDDLKDIIVSDADIDALFNGTDESDETKLNKLREQAIQAAEANKDYAKQLEEQEEAENKKVDSSEKVVDAKKEEAEVTQEVKGGLQDIIKAKVQESKLENQILETKEEEQDVADDIADTQKEVVVITQQANEIDQEKLQAMKDELNAKEKLGAEQKVQLQTLKNEIKEGEKKEKAINKSIEQENKMIGKMQEKIALAQDAEENAKLENEERLKQKAELETHIKLLQQQADEKRQAIALLESEVEYTEDNTFQIKQLTKEYDKLQENISETQARVDDLTDAYYEQQEQARKANNEASQQMMDEYMKRIEQEDEIRRKEPTKYLPAIGGDGGGYKGGDGGDNVPPSGGGNTPNGIDPDLNERIKLRQRELMLSLQQAVHNKDLNDEQKMGVQILAEQVLEVGRLTSSMKDLNWLTQNFRENLKEFKFSIKVDEDNKKELAKIAEEERKELTNMYASLFDEIDANEKLKAEKQSLEELIALYKEKTLAQVDEYSSKNSGYVDQDRVSELRDMIQYMEQNITSAGEYEQVVRNIGNVFRELKFDTNQTKQWYNMEASAEKARQAQEKQAKAQEELNAKVAKHTQVKKEQAKLYEKEIMSSKTMRNATEQERMEMEALIRTYEIKGNTIQEVNQSYAQMQRLVKDMRLDIMNKQLMEQDTWLDKVKNGIKDYVRFTLDLDDIQGVMQNVTRLFSTSFEHIKVLDEAYTNINQTMDITTEEFDIMAQKAYEVGDASGALGTDILEMMKIYANANETVESLNAKVAGTTAFQNVSGLSGTDATNALQTIINQFKLTTEEGYSAGDAITYVGDAITGVAYSLSKDEGDAMREIISAVEDAGSVIKTAGGSLEWYAAVTGTLAETVNATGSEVGGAMRMITARTLQQKEAFDELNDSGEETEVAMANAEKALSGLGISIRESDGDLRSIEEVLGDVAEKWSTLSDSDQQFVAEKLAGTNRRSYFMALMENYQRVMELQDLSMQSEGIMMEASEKHAESLAGKLNQLTNAQEKFYQTLMNSDTMKSWIDFGTDSINMITALVQAMEGKWIPAIVGVTVAYATFKKTVNGLTWGDMISSIGTVVKKMLGLKATIEGVKIASSALKGGIAGIFAGGLVYLVQNLHTYLKDVKQDFRDTADTLKTLNTNINEVSNLEGLISSYEQANKELQSMAITSDEYKAKQEEINGIREQLINAEPSFASILSNENSTLADQLELMRGITDERKRGVVSEQLDSLAPQHTYDDKGAEFNRMTTEGGGLVEDYAVYKELEGELFRLQEEYANTRDVNERQRIQRQMDDTEALMAQQIEYMENTSTSMLGILDSTDAFNEILDTAEGLNLETDYTKVNLDEGGKAFLEALIKIIPELKKVVDGTADINSNLNQASTEADEIGEIEPYQFKYDDDQPTKQQSQQTYIDSAGSIEELNGYLEEMAEQGGVTQDVLEGLFNSGYLEDYNGTLDDTQSLQDHVNGKIQEMEKIANDAYYNMMKDDEAFWSQKIANSEAWRDHEEVMQQDIIGLMANSLNIQAEDFSNFIDDKGGMRAVDYSNASTLAQGENTMQSSLATQVLGYASQLTNGKAGYRQTDMTNVKKFLNEQGTSEAKTVQELATMWAKFYNAKVTAINNTMSEIKSNLANNYSAASLKAQEGWFGDPSKRGLEQQLKNMEKSLESLNYENLTLTNFFSSLDTYFDGVGGGVSQNFTGAKPIGTGGLKGAGSSGYKPSSSGSGGSGSGYKPSGSSGSGGSGSGSGSGASEQEVEDMELEIDRYYTLNDAITDVENALSKLQAERDKITTKSAYKKSMQKEIDLINQQIEALQNLNKEQTKERNEIKSTLSKNGFKFDSTGDITNYASRLKALQNSANSKSGAKKESAIAQVENLVELIERYNELNDSAIPETNIEIIELQNSIAELNKDLEENMKDIEALGDRYFNVSRKIASVDNALAMNKLLQENAEQERKVELMREEQKLMEQKQKYLKEQQKLAQAEADELAKQLKTKGVKLDVKGGITNYDALMKSLTDKANKLVGESQDESVEDAQELIDLINQYVELTESTIPELSQSWQEYANSIEDVNEEFGNMVVETQKDIASAYEHYLTERYNKVKEALQKEQELYNKAYNEENYKRQLDEQQRALDEIAQQIAIYSRDTSEAGKLRLQQLQREYEEQQEAINDMIRENEKSLADERFAEEQAILDEELELLTSPEHLVQVVNDAIGSGLITIGDQVLSLDGVMSNWLNDTGDGLYALGGKLKAELIDNLQNAKDIMTDMGLLKDGSISLASSQALLGSLSNTGALNNSVTFNAPLMTIEGNVDPTVMPELKQELAKLEQTILNKIAKSMK